MPNGNKVWHGKPDVSAYAFSLDNLIHFRMTGSGGNDHDVAGFRELLEGNPLYGVIDSGVEYVSNVGANGDSLVRMPNNSATVPSRWGIRGTEDLGGGLKGLFVLESGFSPDSGTSNQGGRLFGRQALVGLTNQYGQLSFGRQYTMLFWATLDTDILGPNVYSSPSLDSYLPNTRADNAVAYKANFNGFVVGATYSFGRDAVNAGPSPAGTNCAGENPPDKKACREWSAMIGYDSKSWGLIAAYDSQRGGPGAFGGLTNSNLTDDRLSVGGYMLLKNTKLGAGWLCGNPPALGYWLEDVLDAQHRTPLVRARAGVGAGRTAAH